MSHMHEPQVPMQAPWAPPCQSPYQLQPPTDACTQAVAPAPQRYAPAQGMPVPGGATQAPSQPAAQYPPPYYAYAPYPQMQGTPLPGQPVYQPVPQPVYAQMPGAALRGEKTVFGVRAWLILACAVGLALLWFACFGLDAMAGAGPALPGLGVPVFTLAFFIVVFASSGKRLVISPATVVLFIAAVALSLIPALFYDLWLRWIDYFVLGIVCMFEFLLVSGYAGKAWCRLGAAGNAIAFFFASQFRHWTKPFRALSGLGRGGTKRFGGVALGLLIALPVLVVVVPLLVSADAVFGDYVSSFGTVFKFDGPFDVAWKTIRLVLVAPIMFSLVFAAVHGDAGRISHVQPAVGEAGAKHIPATPLITVLAVMSVLYALFVFIQIAYLFGGAESEAIDAIGYAEYARSGFFQLVAVAIINVALILVAVRFAHGAAGAAKGAVSALEVLLLAFTAVILVSAFWRMSLYIGVFGLSLLRALTLFGMAFIAVCLVGTAVKVFHPDFVFFKVFFVAGIGLWLAFNFINVDARIAEYNVNAYLAGSVEQIDVDYLADLSPDAIPALDRLAQQRPEYADDVSFWNSHYRIEKDSLPWQKWCLSYERFVAG